MSQSGRTTPSVEEGLDNLGADWVAGQIRDCFEMFPPECIKDLFKEWHAALRQRLQVAHGIYLLVRQIFKPDRVTC